MNWADVKKRGSKHYKDEDVEPVDLYRSGGMLREFALCNIIKYAFRNRGREEPVRISDMEKIKHYADMLIVACGEIKDEVP